MCSFIFSTSKIEGTPDPNCFSRLRGPDATTQVEVDGYYFLHNLLSITGEFRTQPFVDSDVYCMHNGEIYNYKELSRDYNSDGECIIDAYRQYGPKFPAKLDGEFAILILDLRKKLLTISSDIFGTKPLWYSLSDKGIGVASYRSSLEALNLTHIEQVPANTTIVIDVHTRSIVKKFQFTKFNLEQYKDSYVDWIDSFQLAVKKRANGLREKVFIGLSSGYDSGAIACELLRQGLKFNSYSIPAREDMEVLSRRLGKVRHNELLEISKKEYLAEKRFLLDSSEPYSMPPRPPHRPDGYTVTNDKGAVGTGIICRQARLDGCKIYLSGQGSDEIMSDYGHGGIVANGFTHSDLGGHFPTDLTAAFPWTNFFEGTQREFLYKDEVVGGAYGIECRYPFLDRRLVQEFLWLSPALKNRAYKAPLQNYLAKYKFPYADGLSSKVGFCADYFEHTTPGPRKPRPRNRWTRLIEMALNRF